MFGKSPHLFVIWFTHQLFKVATSLSNITTTEMTTLSSKDCDSGWYRLDDSCYKVNINNEYFQDAVKMCQKDGATLVTIQNSSENNYIRFLISQFTNYQEAWIGLRKVGGDFLWSKENEKLEGYTNWLLDKPLTGSGSCVQMIASGNWNNINCFNRIPFICKKAINPPVEVDNLELILNISIPLSCVFIMFCFVSFLCYKSYSELKEIQAENFEGKPFELVQAAMVLPIARAPDLMTANGKNLWKSAIEKLKQEQIKNNPFNQSSAHLAADGKPPQATDSNSTFADIVNSVMKKNDSRGDFLHQNYTGGGGLNDSYKGGGLNDSYTGGTLGLPIIKNPNIPSICVDEESPDISDDNNERIFNIGGEANDSDKEDNDSSPPAFDKWNVDVKKSDRNEKDNRVEIQIYIDGDKSKKRKKGVVSDYNPQTETKAFIYRNDIEHSNTRKQDDVISNRNCSNLDDLYSSQNRLSRGEFRDSLRRESQRRRDRYFPNSPEKKNTDNYPLQQYETRNIAADYSFVTLV